MSSPVNQAATVEAFEKARKCAQLLSADLRDCMNTTGADYLLSNLLVQLFNESAAIEMKLINIGDSLKARPFRAAGES